MARDNENLQDELQNASITNASADNTAGAEAAKASEDTPRGTGAESGYDSALENQREVIQVLIEQNRSLTEQIKGLLRNGASVTPLEQREQPQPEKLVPDDYVPLSELGKEIGKRNYGEGD